MVEYVEISLIRPANYNPRKITDEQFKKLKESITEIGFIVPVLVNKRNNTIIAGHQRTRAAKSIGMSVVPVLWVDGINIGDEIKFNQIHNAVERLEDSPTVLMGEHQQDRFIGVDTKSFKIGSSRAAYLKEICKLLVKYGNVLSCVVCRGQVVYGSNYVKACELLKLSVNTYILSRDDKSKALKHLNSDYGEYSYKLIERKTYVQGLAQLYRNTVKEDGKKQQASTLYEKHVLPYLAGRHDVSILDFGCGKGDYITALSKKHTAIGLEFYNNNGSTINIYKGNAMIDRLICYIKDFTDFDVVVCDSVLNSVDSKKAEESVMGCLNLFCRNKLFISGRPIDTVLNKYELKTDRYNAKRFLEFMDADNFTANYRKGQWYFQHYHDKEQVVELLARNGFKIIKMDWAKNGDSYQVEANKVETLAVERYIQAIEFEFNLPLPNNKTFNRHEQVISALGLRH